MPDSFTTNGPQGSTSNAEEPKVYAPIEGGPTTFSSPFGEPNHGSPPHTHMGIDIPCGTGTKCFAPVDGTISYATSDWSEGGMVHFKFTENLPDGGIKNGDVIGWGHVKNIKVEQGQQVVAGQHLCDSNHPAPHVHLIYQSPASPGTSDGTHDGAGAYRFLTTGEKNGSGVVGNGENTSSGSGFGSEDAFRVANAAAFASQFQLEGTLNFAESILMKGAKSIFNDEPLMPFIQQLSEASMRHFQSLPNGAFYAFYPDHFGWYHHRKPYWSIDDVEILDGKIDLSDEELKTHVFIVGGMANPGTVTQADRVNSKGVFTIFDAFQSEFFLQGAGTGDTKKDQLVSHQAALAFLQTYGQRPHYDEATFIRNGYFEIFNAFTQWQLMWSRQFLTTFSFTFMPEVYPGGIVAFEDHGLQCYVDSVTHTFDYENGFMTEANLSAPAAYGDGGPVSQGMIRPSAAQATLSNTNAKPSTEAPRASTKKKRNG